MHPGRHGLDPQSPVREQEQDEKKADCDGDEDKTRL